MMNKKTMMAVWLSACLPAFAADMVPPPARVEAPAVTDVSGEVGTLMASGRDSLMAGKSTEALALFEKAIALDPASQEAAFGLSAALMELKRFSEARPVLEKLAREVPDHPMVKNNLAWALLQDKSQGSTNAVRAIKLARSALLEIPSDYSIWNTLGEAYYAAGQFDKTLRAAQSGLRLSDLAGITNSPCRELLIRCRKGAAATLLDKGGEP